MDNKIEYHVFRKKKNKYFQSLLKHAIVYLCEDKEKTGEIYCVGRRASKSINVLF